MGNNARPSGGARSQRPVRRASDRAAPAKASQPLCHTYLRHYSVSIHLRTERKSRRVRIVSARGARTPVHYITSPRHPRDYYAKCRRHGVNFSRICYLFTRFIFIGLRSCSHSSLRDVTTLLCACCRAIPILITVCYGYVARLDGTRLPGAPRVTLPNAVQLNLM
ncbi:hypothetical protein O3G_MSEX011581 [Manduca sexta]|uniref:Uncharacterized protein n=1 Tax=Manduca sexta TaxID=7130 RepID=A0A922CVU2_MANSE|nr:hypothetical protein O3G_MSEX011581 [Manduca sexta]